MKLKLNNERKLFMCYVIIALLFAMGVYTLYLAQGYRDKLIECVGTLTQ